MAMIKSDHHESGIHHRGAAATSANARNGANGVNGHGSSVNGQKEEVVTNSSLPQARKRRSAKAQDSPDDGVRVDVDGGRAKYRKMRAKRSAQLRGRLLLGAICLASFALGFAWMSFTKDDEPRPRPQLRHGTPDGAAPGRRKTRDETPEVRSNSRGGQLATPGSLLIPRFDVRWFVGAWEERVRDAALGQVGQKRPQSIALEGWNYHAAFRVFPNAKQTMGPVKSVDPDYGGLASESIRNEKAFERTIRLGRDGLAVEDAFEPESFRPEESLKKRNRERRRTPGSYPKLDSKGRKILQNKSYGTLRKYYDDDWIEVERKANDGETETPRACLNAEFALSYYPSCNNFHERDIGRPRDDPDQLLRQRPENEQQVKYLAHGYYRDVWLVEDSPWIWPKRYAEEKLYEPQDYGLKDGRAAELVPKAYRSAALKAFRIKHDYDVEHFYEIQLEAIIMDRMTRSPRIMDIYGHCGFSTMVEIVPIELEDAIAPGEGMESQRKYDKRNKDGVKPRNKFTPDEKLGFALQMAESLADLHGFQEGVIVHDDVQPCQWLRTADGRLKLGDFNRATIMQWDAVAGGYCTFNNGNAYANYRAPEEFAVENLNEQIDTFSFGNNLYVMLTGLWPFYDTDDDKVVHEKLIGGKLPFVDPRYKERSFAERKMVELIEKCWAYDPDERISIFDAVDFLRRAVRDNKARRKSEVRAHKHPSWN